MKKLGFGLMRLPLLKEGDLKSIDHERTNRMVDAFLEKGFTYFDTAYLYHQGISEEVVRTALVKRHPRASFLLADKLPVFVIDSADEYEPIFEKQLQRTGAEYFDYYLLHSLGYKNYAKTVEFGGFEYVQKLKAQGLVKHIGLSFHDKAELLDQILTQHPEMEFVQLQINYMDWDNESIEGGKCYEVAVKHKKPVVVMEPVKGGSLASVPEKAEEMLKAKRPDMSIASWAMRFAASLDNVSMVLSGMSNMEQLEDNMCVFDDFEPLSEGEQKTIQEVSAIIQQSIAVPCTSCQYCVDECPQQIPIPQHFSLYNDQHRFHLVPSHMNYYNNLSLQYAKASDCIECGQCESHCPQHIKIIQSLKDVSSVFEPKAQSR